MKNNNLNLLSLIPFMGIYWMEGKYSKIIAIYQYFLYFISGMLISNLLIK